MKRRIAALLLCLATALSLLSGCGDSAMKSNDLMDGITAQTVSSEAGLTGDGRTAAADFAVALFKSASADNNALVSPLSVISALGMTQNGAKGGTLAQMEEVLGLTADELNAYILTYMSALPDSDTCKLSLANAIWLRDDDSLAVEPEFLQKNADHYGAAAYKAAFDASTADDINSWVSRNTDGMIDRIIDEISASSVMYLVNALAFEAEWASVYTEDNVQDGTFTTEGGDARDVRMMYSGESTYIETERATGFLKYYDGGGYAFAALLPNEGVTVSELIDSLTGESLLAVLDNAEYATVNAAIPKFEVSYETELSAALAAMGMADAFDPELADFTGLGTSDAGNIYISRVLHKTCIAVSELGTKAGAVTAVDMECGSAMPTEVKTVYLDRPFIYMIIDCETNLPIFIGTLCDVQ